VSIEIILYPKKARRDDLRDLLVSCGFKPCQHLWDWPKGSLNYWWFDSHDYRSFDGVEATIFKPSGAEQKYGLCECPNRLPGMSEFGSLPGENPELMHGRFFRCCPFQGKNLIKFFQLNYPYLSNVGSDFPFPLQYQMRWTDDQDSPGVPEKGSS
jgi:hypothetical protein